MVLSVDFLGDFVSQTPLRKKIGCKSCNQRHLRVLAVQDLFESVQQECLAENPTRLTTVCIRTLTRLEDVVSLQPKPERC